LQEFILNILDDSIRTKREFISRNLALLQEVILCVSRVMANGNKILLFGNGGSAADAQHIAAEFINRFLMERSPLPALALTTDSSVITSIANDYSYREVFSKQIQALGAPGDAAIGISTSGKSDNVIAGLKAANDKGLITIGLGGAPSSEMGEICRYYLPVTGATPRIQETHILVGHILAEAIERILFGDMKDQEF
jgi:D-sedoheptulose 7-phosphate isomerase